MGVITVGVSDVIDRPSTITINNQAIIPKGVVANAKGIITLVQFWLTIDATNVRVGTVYVSEGTFYTRSWAALGDVPSGSKQTKAVSLQVDIGDYIAISCSGPSDVGQIERTNTSGYGYWVTSKLPFSGVSSLLDVANRDVSLYGTGVTLSKGGSSIPKLIAIGALMLPCGLILPNTLKKFRKAS